MLTVSNSLRIFESLTQNKTADSFFGELKSLHGEEKQTETVKESTIRVCFINIYFFIFLNVKSLKLLT